MEENEQKIPEMKEEGKFHKKRRKMMKLTPENLEKLSKEDLIEFILDHKEEINLQSMPNFPVLPDFNNYEQIHVAFVLAYCGHNYQGLVIQPDTRQTVESKLFDALRFTCFIEDWRTWYFNKIIKIVVMHDVAALMLELVH